MVTRDTGLETFLFLLESIPVLGYSSESRGDGWIEALTALAEAEREQRVTVDIAVKRAFSCITSAAHTHIPRSINLSGQ